MVIEHHQLNKRALRLEDFLLPVADALIAFITIATNNLVKYEDDLWCYGNQSADQRIEILLLTIQRRNNYK